MKEEYVPFTSKIPEDTLEILYDLGADFDLDPLSSTESEDYFYNLLSNYRGSKEGLTLYLTEQLKKDFKVLNENPDWLQGQDWQFNNGKPMCFVGQIEANVNQNDCNFNAMFYIFWDMENGDIKTIMQSD